MLREMLDPLRCCEDMRCWKGDRGAKRTLVAAIVMRSVGWIGGATTVADVRRDACGGEQHIARVRLGPAPSNARERHDEEQGGSHKAPPG